MRQTGAEHHSRSRSTYRTAASRLRLTRLLVANFLPTFKTRPVRRSISGRMFPPIPSFLDISAFPRPFWGRCVKYTLPKGFRVATGEAGAQQHRLSCPLSPLTMMASTSPRGARGPLNFTASRGEIVGSGDGSPIGQSKCRSLHCRTQASYLRRNGDCCTPAMASGRIKRRGKHNRGDFP
jgi:hypothetical protein